jgi:hypothetical protein
MTLFLCSVWLVLAVSDMDECRDSNGQCQSVCINTPGSFSCACESGFLLLTDGRSCIGEHTIEICLIFLFSLLFGRRSCVYKGIGTFTAGSWFMCQFTCASTSSM